MHSIYGLGLHVFNVNITDAPSAYGAMASVCNMYNQAKSDHKVHIIFYHKSAVISSRA